MHREREHQANTRSTFPHTLCYSYLFSVETLVTLRPYLHGVGNPGLVG